MLDTIALLDLFETPQVVLDIAPTVPKGLARIELHPIENRMANGLKNAVPETVGYETTSCSRERTSKQNSDQLFAAESQIQADLSL
jgi:hypothetical protein